MLLHEAIREARKQAGLSQKRLAELAGIQRRQLATLEQGGNVTLSTIRKVIAQLPNLQSFTLDGVSVEVDPAASRAADDLFNESMRLLGDALEGLARTVRKGSYPTPTTIEALRKANRVLAASLEARGRPSHIPKQAEGEPGGGEEVASRAEDGE